MFYDYLSKVNFEKATIGRVEKTGKSSQGVWKIYEVKTSEGGNFEFTMKVDSGGLFTKNVEGKGKKFKVFSLPVIIADRSFCDDGLAVLSEKLSDITTFSVEVGDGGNEYVWIKVPSRNDRILATISLNGKMLEKGEYEFLDEPIGGKVVVRLSGILLSGGGSEAIAQFSLVAADLKRVRPTRLVIRDNEEDEEEDSNGSEEVELSVEEIRVKYPNLF